METKTANSVLEAVGAALEITRKWSSSAEPQYVWFRGINDKNLHLEPGAVWRSGYEEDDPYIDFWQTAGAFTDTTGLDGWGNYFLAQHHGIPTRLLDWTENCLAAIYFATSNWDGSTDPAIWILDPCLFNKISIGWEGLVVPTNASKTSLWLPPIGDSPREYDDSAEGFAYRNENPLAIWPKRSNRRIVAQQGTFTVHGTGNKSINGLLAEKTHATNIIARIDLEGLDPKQARQDLVALGMRHSAIYPDIDNFVKDLQEFHKW